MTRLLFGAGTLLLVAGTAGAQTTIRYEVVDLGVAEGASGVCPCFFPQAVNNIGGVSGFFFGTDGTYNAFTYGVAGMIDISPPGDNRAFARGMNDQGRVVGWTDVFEPQHGFLWDGETLHDLGTLGGTYSDAHDVNNAGRIVGSASTPPPDDVEHAAVWENGGWIDLGTLGGPFSEASAVSETGMIVGWSWNEAWDARAVFWHEDLSGPFALPSFGAPDRFTYANDVNDEGVIVGQIEVDPIESLPAWRAALWQEGEVIDLGLLPEAGQGTSLYGQTAHTSTAARGINNEGVIIGMSFPPAAAPEERHGPWVWRDGTMTNLNDLLLASATDWMITDVAEISAPGSIAASARTPGSNFSRAVLLVPVEVVLGDVDGDGAVGVTDLVTLIISWGPCAGCPADLDDDGVVSVSDLVILLSNWG